VIIADFNAKQRAETDVSVTDFTITNLGKPNTEPVSRCLASTSLTLALEMGGLLNGKSETKVGFKVACFKMATKVTLYLKKLTLSLILMCDIQEVNITNHSNFILFPFKWPAIA
jgi:hypothetical protein